MSKRIARVAATTALAAAAVVVPLAGTANASSYGHEGGHHRHGDFGHHRHGDFGHHRGGIGYGNGLFGNGFFGSGMFGGYGNGVTIIF